MAAFNKIYLSQTIIDNRLSAEFYDPKYIKNVNNSYEWVKIARVLNKCQYGISIKMNESGLGYKIVRMNELNNCFIDEIKKFADISESEKKFFELNFNDVLFNRTNSFEFVGRTSIVKVEDSSVFASYLIKLVTKSELILPEFLTLYLNTDYGVGQIKRRAMQSINQSNVSASEVKQILIPLVDIPTQQRLAKLLNDSYYLKEKSKSLYSQAQSLLEKELGMDKIVFAKDKTFSAFYNETLFNNRSDADFYQIKYRQLEEHLSTLTTKPLSQLASINKGIEVGSSLYCDIGIPFIRVSNLSTMGFTFSASDKYISASTYDNLKTYSPKVNDILLTKDGTIGICYNVTDQIEGVISGGIVKLVLYDSNIPNEYLALVINSSICQMQIERDCSGALILHWKSEQIRKLKIPILSESLMNELADLVNQSKLAKKESEHLLSSAIMQVEALIEQESSQN